MTSKITIGNYTNIKPTSVKWKCSVSNFTDTCIIQLPLKTYVRNFNEELPSLPSGSTEKKVASLVSSNNTVFSEGDAVDVALGYNFENEKRFKGFIKRINYSTPLSLECEGYSYLLKDKIFTKTYTSTTARAILGDLIAGTEIRLSDAIPIIPLKNVVFKNCPGLKVLEWFQKECLLSVFFDFEYIYVGSSKYGLEKPTQKIKLGWNTAEDKALKKDVSDSNIQIHVVEKSSTGTIKRTKSEQTKYSTTKDVKIRHGMPDSIVKKIANELQKQENFRGYKGDITCFLQPNFEKGYVAEISDLRFPDRNGSYFVESIDGSFDSSGGRQTLTLIYYGNVDGTGN